VTQYREAFTQSFVDTARERCPHMNALAICTPHGAFPNTKENLPFLNTTIPYACYVFESGTLTSSSDGGFEN
jgi:hypothetical protein